MNEIARVEVILDNLQENPRCPHGPTLLFKRIIGDEERKFYACSACRDRKDCNFFLWADEKFTPSKKNAWDLEQKRIFPEIDHAKLYKKFLILLDKTPEYRAFCHTCSILLLESEVEKHDGHDVTIGISEHQLRHPSSLLKPLESAKKEAQYLFSHQTTKTIINIAQHLGAQKLLCVGAPRIHELVCSKMSSKMDSLLLDIDYRYHQFNSPKQFCWFNSFNNHFFSEEEGAQVLSQFLQDEKVIVLVMDPPFGGRVEPLAKTVQEILHLRKKLCPQIEGDMIVLWIFPYFMEPQVLASCPNFSMLDYKVDYDNHPLFASGPKGRKYGSPVRIFTNASPKDIPLPIEQGYNYCKICQRWVSEENRHCMKCNACTSKDGRTYAHCDACTRCVKPTWKHCTTCERCCLPSHVCGEFVPSQSCFNCGVPGHKKRDCPNFNQDSIPVTKLDPKTELCTISIGKRKNSMKTEVAGSEKKQGRNSLIKKQKLQIVNKQKLKPNKKKKKKSKLNSKRKIKLQL